MSALSSTLRESNDLEAIKTFLEFTPDAMLVVGHDGKIALCNSEAELLFANDVRHLANEAPA